MINIIVPTILFLILFAGLFFLNKRHGFLEKGDLITYAVLLFITVEILWLAIIETLWLSFMAVVFNPLRDQLMGFLGTRGWMLLPVMSLSIISAFVGRHTIEYLNQGDYQEDALSLDYFEATHKLRIVMLYCLIICFALSLVYQWFIVYRKFEPFLTKFISIPMVLLVTGVTFFFLISLQRIKVKGPKILLSLLIFTLSNLGIVTVFYANIYYCQMHFHHSKTEHKEINMQDCIISFNEAGDPIDDEDGSYNQFLDYINERQSLESIEITLPVTINSRKRHEIEENLRKRVMSVTEHVRGFEDNDLSFRDDYMGNIKKDSSYFARVRVRDRSDPFLVSSGKFYDALYMSGIMIISIGLTENYPVSSEMKFYVFLEQLTGVMFFIIFVGGIVVEQLKEVPSQGLKAPH